MEEAIVSGAISICLFLFGYGRLIERINNLKAQNETMQTEMKLVIEMRVAIAKIESDISHIKVKLDETT